VRACARVRACVCIAWKMYNIRFINVVVRKAESG